MENKVNLKCEIHGITTHGYYSSKKSIVIRCLKCESKKTALRRIDYFTRLHDSEYTKQWILDNKDYVKKQAKERHIQNQENKEKIVKEFILNNENRIKQFLIKIKSPLSFEKIQAHCIRFYVIKWTMLKRHIIQNKQSQLLNKETFQQSAYVKYKWGVSKTWSELPDVIKSKIRKEYKQKAKNIVKTEIIKLVH